MHWENSIHTYFKGVVHQKMKLITKYLEKCLRNAFFICLFVHKQWNLLGSNCIGLLPFLNIFFIFFL